MAVKVAQTAQNISGGTFYTSDTSNLGCFSATTLSLSAGQTLGFTPTQGYNLSGATLCLTSGTAHCDKSVKVQLQKNVSGTWTDVTVANGFASNANQTLTQATMTHSTANTSADGWFITFNWTAFAVTAVASTWRFNITQTGGSTGNWAIRTSDGTNPFYVVSTSLSGSFTSGTDALVALAPVTFNAAVTLKGVLGTGDATNSVACVVGIGSGAPTLSSNNANFVTPSSPGSSYTIAIDGWIVLGAHSAVSQGSSSSRVPASQTTIISFTDPPSSGTGSGITNSSGSGVTTSRWSWFAYGAYPTTEQCKLHAGVTAGATTFTTTSDISAWGNGDVVTIGRCNTQGTGDTARYTLTGTPSLGGGVYTATIGAITSGSTNNRIVGGTVAIHTSRGLKISGGTTNSTWKTGVPSNFIMSGVQFEGFITSSNNNSNQYEDVTNTSQFVLEHTAIYTSKSGTPIILGFTSQTYGLKIDTCIFNQCIGYNATTVGGASLPNITFNKVFMYNLTSAPNFNNLSGLVFTNNVFDQATSPFILGGGKLSVTGNDFWGCNSSTSVLSLGNNFSGIFGNNHFNNNAMGILMSTAAGQTAALIDSGSYFGDVTANTADIALPTSGAYIGYEWDNESGAVSPATTNQLKLTEGSYLRFYGYNTTAGDNRSLVREGFFMSSSGNLQAQPNNTAATDLTAQYNFNTGSVNTMTVGVQVTEQISNSAYYGGTNYVLPRIVVNVDLADRSPVSGSADTSAHSLADTFTPATNNNPISVKLDTNSDAGTSTSLWGTGNALVTWSSLTVSARQYAYKFQTFTPDITKILDSALGTIVTPVSDSFITVTNPTTVSGYTEFTINHSTQTITITASTTMQRLYDYIHWDLCQSSNLFKSEWYTTSDGVNFTSAYNFALNTGVALTGGGTINVGSQSFTRSGTATYDGIVITSSNRSVHIKFIGILSGSQYYVSKQSDGSQVLNSTASGNTDDLYTYTADLPINYTIRYAGYVQVTGSGTITNQGLTINVSQSSDGTY